MINAYTPVYVSGATTTNVATGTVFIHTIVVPIASAGTLTFRDRASSPVTYFVLPIGSVGSFLLDAVFPNGLAIVTSASDKAIITYE